LVALIKKGPRASFDLSAKQRNLLACVHEFVLARSGKLPAVVKKTQQGNDMRPPGAAWQMRWK
jgi:hypothetical protein